MLPIKTTHRARLANAAPDGCDRIKSSQESAAGETRRAGLTTVGGANRVSGPLEYTDGSHTHQCQQGATHEIHRCHRLQVCGRTVLRASISDCEDWGDAACGANLHRDGCKQPLVHVRKNGSDDSRRETSISPFATWHCFVRGAVRRRRKSADRIFLTISHPRRYIMCSWLRLVRLGWSQFWPYFLPVIWAQVTAGYRAVCGLLNGIASLNGYRPDSAGPLPHQLHLRADLCRQLGLCPVLVQVVIEFHAHSISASLIEMQASRSFFFLSASLLIKP